jgi:hypothetical protein
MRAALLLITIAVWMLPAPADAACWIAFDCSTGQGKPIQDCDSLREPRPVMGVPPISPICPIVAIKPIGPIAPITPIGTNWCGLRYVSDRERTDSYSWKMVCLPYKPSE